VVNMSEDDWEPDLESEEEPPSDDESRGQSDGAGSSMGSDSSENVEDWQALEIIFDLPFGFPLNNIISLRQEANRIGTQGTTTCG